MNPGGRDSLQRAARLYAWGRWAKVVTLLEPLTPLYRHDPGFFRLLGGSWFHLGDLFAASLYLERSHQLAPGQVETTLACAALHASRGQDAEAAALYLELLDHDPACTPAKEGMEWLRTREHAPIPVQATSPVICLWPEDRLPPSIKKLRLSIVILALVAVCAVITTIVFM